MTAVHISYVSNWHSNKLEKNAPLVVSSFQLIYFLIKRNFIALIRNRVNFMDLITSVTFLSFLKYPPGGSGQMQNMQERHIRSIVHYFVNCFIKQIIFF